VEKMYNYTRNRWRRCKTTLGTSGEDAKLHSKRVEKMKIHPEGRAYGDQISRNGKSPISSKFKSDNTEKYTR
jgi:hypothetical protein